MVPDDIAMFNSQDTILVLVLPRLPNVIAWELTRNYHSNCGNYELLASINIILEHMNDSIRSQLTLADEAVESPLLQNFSQSIRLIGMFNL